MEKTKYDARHGGPYDRGGADSYYGREYQPHYYRGGTGTSERVEALTAEELEAYNAGYEDNEKSGDKKNWF
jgi:hypothetical protein